MKLDFCIVVLIYISTSIAGFSMDGDLSRRNVEDIGSASSNRSPSIFGPIDSRNGNYCHSCDMHFGRSDEFLNHLKIHISEGPLPSNGHRRIFTCEICSEKIVGIFAFRRHVNEDLAPRDFQYMEFEEEEENP